MENLSLDTYNINFIEDIIENNNLSKLDYPNLLDPNEKELDTSKLCNAITYSKYQSLLNFVNMELNRLTLLKRGILEHAKKNFIINNAQCTFRKTTNKIYHLYHKKHNVENTYLSLISKEEWGDKFEDTYLASYRLNNDLTWEQVK